MTVAGAHVAGYVKIAVVGGLFIASAARRYENTDGREEERHVGTG